MRSFFHREVTSPDIERRNRILSKLARLRGDISNKDVIKHLRTALRATDGLTLYYRYHSGIKLFIGTVTTPKKRFLLSKDNGFLRSFIKDHRRQYKGPVKVKKKSKQLRSGFILHYSTVGGVMYKSDVFKTENLMINRKKVTVAKVPKTKDPYIGIEIEYASRHTLDAVVDTVIQHGLQDSVRVMHDGSIKTTDAYPHKVEFCILTKFSELSETLQKLKPIIFDKPQNFYPNNSCGLHVHLDMRNDDPRRVYKNLVSMQSVLFQLANESRRENDFCRPVEDIDFDDVNADDGDAHYDAISKYSYYKHNTIEVRIHHSTLDLTQIEKWIRLLRKIADYKGEKLKMGTLDTELAQLKDKVKLEPDLLQYIEARRVV